MNIELNGGDGGCWRGKVELMPVVAGSRIDDLVMVSSMVLGKERIQNVKQLRGLLQPLIIEWE